MFNNFSGTYVEHKHFTTTRQVIKKFKSDGLGMYLAKYRTFNDLATISVDLVAYINFNSFISLSYHAHKINGFWEPAMWAVKRKGSYKWHVTLAQLSL